VNIQAGNGNACGFNTMAKDVAVTPTFYTLIHDDCLPQPSDTGDRGDDHIKARENV